MTGCDTCTDVDDFSWDFSTRLCTSTWRLCTWKRCTHRRSKPLFRVDCHQPSPLRSKSSKPHFLLELSLFVTLPLFRVDAHQPGSNSSKPHFLLLLFFRVLFTFPLSRCQGKEHRSPAASPSNCSGLISCQRLCLWTSKCVCNDLKNNRSHFYRHHWFIGVLRPLSLVVIHTHTAFFLLPRIASRTAVVVTLTLQGSQSSPESSW